MLKCYVRGDPPAVFPKKRSVLLAAVVLLVCCCLVVPAVAADEVDISTGSIVITESGYTVAGSKTPWSSDDHTLTVTGRSAAHHITVISGSCTIVLQDATITPSDDPAISICANDGGTGATVTLVVMGENTLKGGTGCAAVEVKAGWDGDDYYWSEVCSGRLIITGSGTLSATGGDGSTKVGGGAGIGGNGVGISAGIHTDGGDFGSICIAEGFSGKINAKGGNTSSAIGAGAGIGGGGSDAEPIYEQGKLVSCWYSWRVRWVYACRFMGVMVCRWGESEERGAGSDGGFLRF